MLTYDLTKTDGPLYKCLYECIKNDISQGKLSSGEKMPSKRTLAKNLGVSTITVENAYDQLIGEGYMFARPKRGYFIADVSDIRVIKAPVQKELSIKLPPEQDESIFDFSSNRTDSGNFPFSIWAKLMRETISLREQELLSVSPCGGVRELREAIASHLSSFRGMNVDPDQIIVGAGTEYLYGLLVKLLGTDKVYCVEDPGYKKISQIYECNNAKCLPVQMDEQGISVELIKKANAQKELSIKLPPEQDESIFDFSSNRTDSGNFPFSIWAKLMRETISLREQELLSVSPCGGVRELREAIASHLSSFRGMNVDPDQIIVGAGTEYLYGLLVKLLGTDKVYCVEDPGYKKISQIYECNNAKCLPVQMDEQGISVELIKKANAQIAHISPTHHFPTGITMPVNRRYELLAWANESSDRYIIEDDYDSEFRMNGHPIPPILSIDACEKVIYINTFSKSLTSTIRISYMVLPEHLANEFYRRLSFYSCTVSTFEQYTLARFISEGYFEKHINRMRLHYGRKRQSVLSSIKGCFTEKECRVIENDSGLHFIIQFDTNIPDKTVEELLFKKGIKLQAITHFNLIKPKEDRHQFIINYSNIDADRIMDKLLIIKETIL